MNETREYPEIRFEFKRAIHTSADRWYRVVQWLGGGGSAVTYLVLGTDGPLNGALFAIKFFRRLDSEQRRRRFLHEIRFLKDCDHPSIMHIVESGAYTDRALEGEFVYPFFVAEYLPRTMYDVMRENQSTFVEKASYIVQLLSALACLASRNPAAVHRDIKPQNIFIKGKTCLLGDFGLMTTVDREAELDRGVLAHSNKPAMPWYYRTPDLVEFEKNGTRLTPASDVFQLGLIAAQLFTGWNPLKAARDLLDPIELEPIGYIPGVGGAGVKSLLNRMLQIDPARRPSAHDLLDPWRDVFWEAADAAIKLNGKAM